ncbi:MAG: 3-isopropylmalate dehydratase small subunit [Deltaproteobacteria bacterium]|nr:3-isopropylmalate dehydratase small subunit [Deltaproteobacteria bacterium]
MKFKGKAWKFGADVDTDQIIPARYLNTSDPKELAKHCMEDADPQFVNKMKPGDIIVADKNFGCGSSREHAPIAIKAAGISCVIAKSFARIFYRNSFNMGLPILECPEAVDAIAEGNEVEVDLNTGEIKVNAECGMRNVEAAPKIFKAQAIPPFMQELINTGGLMEWVKKKVHGS